MYRFGFFCVHSVPVEGEVLKSAYNCNVVFVGSEVSYAPSLVITGVQIASSSHYYQCCVVGAIIDSS